MQSGKASCGIPYTSEKDLAYHITIWSSFDAWGAAFVEKEKKNKAQAVKIDHKSHKTSKDIYLFPFPGTTG